MSDHAVRVVLWLTLAGAVVAAVLLLVGCGDDDVHDDDRCETGTSVILDNNDFECWLEREGP